MDLNASTSSQTTDGAPCVFKGCRGLFHAGASTLGVVMCQSWGPDGLAARDEWRRFGAAIAAAGYPCLDFDYPGTGESAGAMTDIQDVADWTDSIDAAANFLRAYSGVKTFVFVGQGLGAALAMRAAGLRGDVFGLLLIAPVAHGRAYLAALSGGKVPAGDVTLDGFRLGSNLARSLTALDATKSECGGVARAIVFDQIDRKAGAEVSEFYKRAGISTSLMPVAPRTKTETPGVAMTARLLAALDEIKPNSTRAKAPRVPLLPATLRMRDYREEPLNLGAGRFGMLCRPLDGSGREPVFVLLTEHASSRIGWGRVCVDQARALAAAGFPSLRLDAPRDAADAVAAVEAMVARGHGRIVLVGVGAAATDALRTAGMVRSVCDVIAVNAPRLVRDQTETTGDAPDARMVTRRLAAMLPPHVRARLEPWMDALRAFGAPKVSSAPPGHDCTRRVKALFADLSARGARVSLVYGDNDPSLRALRLAYGPLGRDLRLPGTSISLMPGADPRVTNPDAAAMLLAHMVAVGREGDQGMMRDAA